MMHLCLAGYRGAQLLCAGRLETAAKTGLRRGPPPSRVQLSTDASAHRGRQRKADRETLNVVRRGQGNDIALRPSPRNVETLSDRQGNDIAL